MGLGRGELLVELVPKGGSRGHLCLGDDLCRHHRGREGTGSVTCLDSMSNVVGQHFGRDPPQKTRYQILVECGTDVELIFQLDIRCVSWTREEHANAI